MSLEDEYTKIEWYEQPEDKDGITSIAVGTLVYGDDYEHRQIVGYNGMMKGDKVLHDGEEWTIVMVSRLGDFGLSKTGELPYVKRVHPNAVCRL